MELVALHISVQSPRPNCDILCNVPVKCQSLVYRTVGLMMQCLVVVFVNGSDYFRRTIWNVSYLRRDERFVERDNPHDGKLNVSCLLCRFRCQLRCSRLLDLLEILNSIVFVTETSVMRMFLVYSFSSLDRRVSAYFRTFLSHPGTIYLGVVLLLYLWTLQVSA